MAVLSEVEYDSRSLEEIADLLVGG